MLKRRDPLTHPWGIHGSTLIRGSDQTEIIRGVNFNEEFDLVIKIALNKFERFNIETLSMQLGN